MVGRPAIHPAWLRLLLLPFFATGLQTRADDSNLTETPGNDSPAHPRPVRVLIASDVDAVRLRSDAPLQIRCEGAARRFALPPANEFTVRIEQGALRIGDSAPFALSVEIQPSTDGTSNISFFRDRAWTNPSEYPGGFYLFVDDDRLSVVNLVDIDDYVAGVVAGETWPSFAEESFRAQAIIARTFVLYQMSRGTKQPFDVSATQGSQVYRGVRADPVSALAAEATDYTRGVVCTFNDGAKERLFCTYYSAACGGCSQSAAALGAEGNVRPLAGGVRCDFCKIAPGDVYRWGPVRIPVSEALVRLVARYPEFAGLGEITGIMITQRSPQGRPTVYRIKGRSGETRTLLAERFRLALGGNLIKSTDAQIRVANGEIVFEEGKGFGHGLGLCQWGMQGQALRGRAAAEILRYYYPSSHLTRAY